MKSFTGYHCLQDQRQPAPSDGGFPWQGPLTIQLYFPLIHNRKNLLCAGWLVTSVPLLCTEASGLAWLPRKAGSFTNVSCSHVYPLIPLLAEAWGAVSLSSFYRREETGFRRSQSLPKTTWLVSGRAKVSAQTFVLCSPQPSQFTLVTWERSGQGNKGQVLFPV